MHLSWQRKKGQCPRCRGFTIIEMVVATFLTALLAVLLAVAMATFARPAAEVDGRTKLALEASIAAESLARDLGGFLADNSGTPGTLNQYQFTSWSFSTDGSTLYLNYQGASGPPLIVTYQQDPQHYQLIRNQLSTGVQNVVAQHVTSFHVAADTANPNNVRVQLGLTYPDPSSTRLYPRFEGTYVLIGVPPPPCPPPR